MAEVRRKHGRLEIFLHRMLAGEASKVSWYETCIVDGGPAKKPCHGFVVITDGLLYLVDDPPKRVRAALALGDVTSIRMVHEKPLFLRGEDRERTQHIKIGYKIKNTHHLLTQNNFRTLSRLETVSSRASSCASSVMMSDTETDRKRRKLRKLLSSLSWSKDTKTTSNGQVEPYRSASVLDFVDSSSEDYSRISEGIGKGSARKLWPFSALAVGEVFLTSKPHSIEIDSPASSPMSRHSWAQRKRPELLSPDLISSDTSSLLSSTSSMRSTEMIPRSHTVLGNYEDHRLGSSTSLFSRRSETKPLFVHIADQEEIEIEGELHIYILAPQSTFFAHLNGTWQNRLIKETLELDEDQHISFNKNNGREHYEQVLQDLYRKLLRKSDDSFVHIRLQVERIMKDIGNSPFVKKNILEGSTSVPSNC